MEKSLCDDFVLWGVAGILKRRYLKRPLTDNFLELKKQTEIVTLPLRVTQKKTPKEAAPLGLFQISCRAAVRTVFVLISNVKLNMNQGLRVGKHHNPSG